MSTTRSVIKSMRPVALEDKRQKIKNKIQAEERRDPNPQEPMSDEDMKDTIDLLLDPQELVNVLFSTGWTVKKELKGKDGKTYVEESQLKEAKIKLIFTSLPGNPIVRRVKGKLIGVIGEAKFGFVHTAVQIGPLIFEWGNSGLVVPVQVTNWCSDSGTTSIKVITALDIDVMQTDKFFQGYAKKVAEVLVKWNGSYDYNVMTNNCQKFCIDIFNALDIQRIIFTDKIEQFLNTLQNIPSDLPLEFTYKFEGDSQTYVIKSHQYLDEICHEKKVEKNSEEYAILKAYDRAFWIRYLRISQSKSIPSEDKSSLMNKYKSGQVCFFDSPDNTNSMYGPGTSDKDILES